ncbi:hypothetical protein BVX97_02700 [bacterium E08(2017)]|nr:hypothetical protein BVX97_02700 [bacterium E08(2017)]
MQLVDDTGSVQASYEYDAFGNIIASSGTMADENPFRFSTKHYDDETGLSYYGFRYYSAELGRWISKDPLGERGGVNLYGFVANSPISLFDLLGLVDCDELRKALVMARLAAAAYDEGGDVPPDYWTVEMEGHLDSGFDYKVYKNAINDDYVLALRGTQPLSGKDWKADIQQGLGKISDQYKDAKELADLMGTILEQGDLSNVVGHSLGGGLAAAIGSNLGVETFTFNAAGLHQKTMDYFNIDSKKLSDYVNKYTVDGDILTSMQEAYKRMPEAAGVHTVLQPDISMGDRLGYMAKGALSTPWFIPAGAEAAKQIDLHSMDEMIEALRKKIEECCE